MPHRFPPPEPDVLPRNPTRAQITRYQSRMNAWYVGQALRAYAETMKSHGRIVSDDIPLLSSPSFEGGGGRKLADNGTPSSMNAICHWIDRQNATVLPIKYAYRQLSRDLPVYARVAWLRHVRLHTIEEIATQENVTSRTVIRYLGVANLRLVAALRSAAGTKTGRTEARYLRDTADRLEAAAWRGGDVPLTPSDEAFAGVRETKTA